MNLPIQVRTGYRLSVGVEMGMRRALAVSFLVMSVFAARGAGAQEAPTNDRASANGTATTDAPVPAGETSSTSDASTTDGSATRPPTVWGRPNGSWFYARVMAGAGITEFNVEGLSDSRAVTYNFTGSLGYPVLPYLIVGAEMDAAGAPDAGIWFNVNSNWTNETSLGYVALGPMVIAYAPWGSHASASVGFSRFTLNSDLPDQGQDVDLFFEVMSKWGLATTLNVGHEFRVIEGVWLGVAAQLYYSQATGDEIFFEQTKVTARGIGLVLTGSAQH